MNIKDILDSEITEQSIKERIMREGNLVMQTISTPGWDLILGSLLAAKIKAENLRKKAIVKQSTRENALYYSGIVDGVEEAKNQIYEVIKAAQEMNKEKETSNDE